MASASARLARECGARRGHFISAYATACRYQVTGSGPGAAHDSGSPVSRGERQAFAGRADQLGAVAVGQRPGHERPGPVAARDPPADLERLPSGPAPDREDPDIERTHRNPPLEVTGTSRSQPHHRKNFPAPCAAAVIPDTTCPVSSSPARSGPAIAARHPPRQPAWPGSPNHHPLARHIRHHRRAMTAATRPPACNIVTQGNRGRDATPAEYSQIAEYALVTGRMLESGQAPGFASSAHPESPVIGGIGSTVAGMAEPGAQPRPRGRSPALSGHHSAMRSRPAVGGSGVLFSLWRW